MSKRMKFDPQRDYKTRTGVYRLRGQLHDAYMVGGYREMRDNAMRMAREVSLTDVREMHVRYARDFNHQMLMHLKRIPV